jgi:aminoglycoside phosphotransferase family enzyme
MPRSPRRRPPTLTDKRAFLASGAPWPDQPAPHCIETHASLVFLTQDRVFKLKKPICLPHADMRSLSARAHLCAEELRLNRAMAGDVYRGIVALVQRPEGGLALGGAGRVVDWLIEMERLPAPAMLDCRILDGPPPTQAEIVGFGRVMASFYRRQTPKPGAGGIYAARLEREMETDLAHLRQMRGHLGEPLRDDVLDKARETLALARPLILARGALGLVIEGHGDLRAEHVCLTHPPLAFDRVEFDHDFRLIDPQDEMLGLGLDCARLGVDWIGSALCESLVEAGFPAPDPALARAYVSARCLTQARLAIDHLRDPSPRTPLKWAPRAQAFLALAARSLAVSV